MKAAPDITWQPSLLDTEATDFDRGFTKVSRVYLDHESWVDHQPEWVSGSDDLFGEILELRNWGQRSRRMYENRVVEPRLTAPWNVRSGQPLEPPILEEMRVALSARYSIEFDSVGFNLYRMGGTAWPGTGTGSRWR